MSDMSKFSGSVELLFHGALREGEYKLLEVSEAILNEIQNSQFEENTRQGKNMVEFRGNQTDEAALVTAKKTYSVRLVESSNTQLLVSSNPSIMFPPAAPTPTTTTPANADKEESKEDLNPSPMKKAKLDHPSSSNDGSSSAASGASAVVELPVRTIEGAVQHHYEVIEILPRLHVLRDLLMQHPFDETDEEENQEEAIDLTTASSGSKQPVEKKLFTMQQLKNTIQASDVELKAGMDELDAFVDHKGHCRILNPDYTAKVFESLRNFFQEKQWTASGERIELDQCVEGLKELYPKEVVQQVVRMHSKPQVEGEDANVFSFDAIKVCRFYAIQLFAKKQPYPQIEFVNDWKSVVPEGMTPSLEMLKGFALSEVSTQLEAMSRGISGATPVSASSSKADEGATLQWRYFPASSLSPLVKTRFAQLFDARAKWRLSDIEPYVSTCCVPGQTLEQLLLKQTRPITDTSSGQKTIVYTRK